MTCDGWIKAHRAMLDHPLLQRADEIGLWMRLLLMAAHRPQRTRLRGQIIALERGQAAVVMTDLVEPDGMSRKRLRLIVESWVKDGMLTISHAKGQACSIVTICNFDAYQSPDEREGPSSDEQNLTNQSGAKGGPSSAAKTGQAEGQGERALTDCNIDGSGRTVERRGQALGQGGAKLGGDLGPTEQEDKKDTGSSLDSQAKEHSDPSDRAAKPPKDAKSHLWEEMKGWLGGKRPGALIGKWCKEYTEGDVFNAYFKAKAENPADRISWMIADLKQRAAQRVGAPAKTRSSLLGAVRILQENGALDDDPVGPEGSDPDGIDAAQGRNALVLLN